MKKLTLIFIIASNFLISQTKIKWSQMANPATSSVNLGSQTFSVGNIFSNGNLSINQSGGVNSLSPKKYSIQPWTADNSYLVEYAAQNIPSSFNISRIWDSTLQKISGPKTLYLGQGSSNGLQIQTTESFGNTGADLANGEFLFNSGPATNTAQANGYIPMLTLGVHTYSMTGGTVSLARLIRVEVPNIKSNSATTITEWATMHFPSPTFDAGITPTRVFGVTTNTDISVAGRGIFGLASTVPSATLDVRGTFSVSSTATLASTLKLGTNAAVLTGGNTGTVAVLTDITMPFSMGWANASPADALTYYLTAGGSFNANIAGNSRTVLPYNCTFIGYSLNNINLGGNGSAESATITIRKNNSTNTDLKTDLSFASTQLVSDFAQSIDFNSTDDFSIFIKCPTWVTNPTQTFLTITLYFVRRK